MRCAVALITILTAAGISFGQEAEGPGAVSEACLADPGICLEQKRLEFETRGTLGLDLHPEQDGDTITWTVHGLDAGAAAEAAGLALGDILVQWNGRAVSTAERPDLMKELVTELRAGDEVEIRVSRGSETRTVKMSARAPDEWTIELWLRYFARKYFDDEIVNEYFHRLARGAHEAEAGEND